MSPDGSAAYFRERASKQIKVVIDRPPRIVPKRQIRLRKNWLKNVRKPLWTESF
jgi:hypothetical protein